MPQESPRLADVHATVIEVLPSLGLAWLQDDEHREWAITRSTPGVDLAQLQPGSKVCLCVQAIDGRLLPCSCH